MVRHIKITSAIGIVIAVIANVSEAGTRHLPPPQFRETKNFQVNSDVSGLADIDPDYRLPNNTEPVHYDVDLETNVHTGEKPFTGTVKILVKVIEDSRSIVLHARQTSDYVATIKNAANPNAQELLMNTEYEAEREFLTLTPTNQQTTLPKDSQWTLTIQYKGQLRTDNGGFYLSTYKDTNNNTRFLATTQFESTNARHAFPCYDEPAKRATFTITIRHSSTYKAISNTPVDEANSRSGVTVFQKTQSMSTYLVAFIVSDFQWTEGSLNSLPQRVFSRPGTEHDQEWALVSGMLIVQRLADYYGVNFAFPKLDQVAVPDFAAGAMENWGLVTYRESALLYNKENSTVNTQTSVTSIIAHEYTHQWFGNLVAVKWWTYLWLKEGFATLFAIQATDDAYPEWGVYQAFHVGDYQSALLNDASNSPRPMTHYVQKPNEISSLYDTVSYGKAGCVLSMWQHALTNKVFQRGLHNYLTVNQFSSAEEDQLFTAIQNAAKELNYPLTVGTVAEMMKTWTNQGGYPLLTVKRNYDDGSFTVEQSAFFNDANHKENKTWYVPFNYATHSKADFRNTEATNYLANIVETKISANVSKVDWLILNKQSTGYYRINYDDRNWQLIAEGLRKHTYKIHPRNRAQLMHDAYRFSVMGELNHSILLDLMTYLANEDQYAPWSTANGILNTYNRYLNGDKQYEDFQFFTWEILEPIYGKLGVNDLPGEQHFQKYTRSIVINLACMVGSKSCLEETENKLSGLVNDNIPVEPNLETVITCNGLRETDNQVFDSVYNRMMSTESQELRNTLISALGCAQTTNQIKKFIESSIDESNQLRSQERITLLRSAYSRSKAGLEASIDFLNDKWEAYANLNPGFGGSNPLDDDLRGMSQYVVNEEQEKKMLQLIDTVKDSDKLTDSLETNVRANIKNNFDWLKRNRDPLMKWFYSFRNASPALTASFMSVMSAVSMVLLRML